jgi:hypothetical protein
MNIGHYRGTGLFDDDDGSDPLCEATDSVIRMIFAGSPSVCCCSSEEFPCFVASACLDPVHSSRSSTFLFIIIIIRNIIIIIIYLILFYFYNILIFSILFSLLFS